MISEEVLATNPDHKQAYFKIWNGKHSWVSKKTDEIWNSYFTPYFHSTFYFYLFLDWKIVVRKFPEADVNNNVYSCKSEQYTAEIYFELLLHQRSVPVLQNLYLERQRVYLKCAFQNVSNLWFGKTRKNHEAITQEIKLNAK